MSTTHKGAAILRPLLSLLLAAWLLADSQPRFCWFSDGWRGSGSYNCETGPWVKEYEQQQVPRRRELQT